MLLSSKRLYSKAITKDTIMPNIKDFKYAVRGEIAIWAQQIDWEMEKGKKFPFEKITMLHVGNPQQLGQRGFTFNR